MSQYKKGYLSDFFDGFAVKRLTKVEVDPSSSHQHEFQGVQDLRRILGTPGEKVTFNSRFIWLNDEGKSETIDSFVTWSNVRKDKPRAAEYHLYYSSDSDNVVQNASPGDLLIVCKKKSGDLLVVLTPAGGTIESQLSWLFDFTLEEYPKPFVRELDEKNAREIDLAASFILGELGIEAVKADESLLDLLITRFGANFPSTAQFSAFARESLSEVTPKDNPDDVLIKWLDHEEKLFKTFEKYIVSERLKEGFYSGDDANVEDFIKFSLSVHNRRKSRAGYSLENHLEPIFVARNIQYVRGAKTELNLKPDFIFPGFKEYHDMSFPDEILSMLGAKSTCKDRWRQVLNEAARVKTKHLLTLEPSISENQTAEMRGNNLQLVVPRSLHTSYTPKQRDWLFNLNDFLDYVIKKQKVYNKN